jgi:hypothetical protein
MHTRTSAGRLAIAAFALIGAASTWSSTRASRVSAQDRPTAARAATSPSSSVGDVERLVATEEIKRLKARYFRCLDMKDWTCLEGVYAPDAQVTFLNSPSADPKSVKPLMGRAAVIASMRRGVEPLRTVHHGHMPEIEILSPTTAKGIWAMEDLIERPGGKNLTTGYGHYHETYERIDGQWRIKTLLLTRLRMDRSERE